MAGVACFAGLLAEAGDSLQVVLPGAAVVGLGLAVVALRTFKIFIFLILIVRASFDLVKVSSGLGGQASPRQHE